LDDEAILLVGRKFFMTKWAVDGLKIKFRYEFFNWLCDLDGGIEFIL
jgi:hypothetical protein